MPGAIPHSVFQYIFQGTLYFRLIVKYLFSTLQRRNYWLMCPSWLKNTWLYIYATKNYVSQVCMRILSILYKNVLVLDNYTKEYTLETKRIWFHFTWQNRQIKSNAEVTDSTSLLNLKVTRSINWLRFFVSLTCSIVNHTSVEKFLQKIMAEDNLHIWNHQGILILLNLH